MNSERKMHLLDYFKEGFRPDGRKLDEFRPITIEAGTIKTAEGSAIVTIGGTRVIVGVKMQVEKPYSDRPNEGTMMVGAELYPMASPKFESGPPNAQSIEIARVIDRGLRESKAIDTKGLCLIPGEKCWSVIMDVCAMNEEGNLLDAGSIAALAALNTTIFPGFDGTIVDYKHPSDRKLELKKQPIAITVVKIANYLLVDPTNEEEQAMDARLTVTTTAEGTICSLQKGGEASLLPEEIQAMLELAKTKAKEIRGSLSGKGL
ncbi:RNA-binding protein [Candidatus Woesearchaeota archaeon CG_4_10_14_0_2_um_filter_57_5]|nr:MAG: hypothetical protein AUJ68_03100 [Candidatus Woesearchaeota archaeon CG1_02_57_44]PIZ48732.1 MAG: RNA-binding protein [Candidatus Woesearchaeota archaeon CG_4_10_14_0_2_um_filter_57_5]